MEDKRYKSISVKNAKKIIFYFTSRLLFMILAIIFITYGCSMFVHADEEYNVTVNYIPNPEYSTLGSITNNVQLPFNNTEIGESFSTKYGDSVYNPMDNYSYYFTADHYDNDSNFSLLKSDVPIITKFSGMMNGANYDVDYSTGDYYIMMFYPTFSSDNIKFSYYIFPKTFIYKNRYVNTVNVNYPRIDVTIYNNGNITFNSNADYSISVYCQQVLFSDMPMWVTNGADINSNDVEPNVTDTFDSNYIANINIPLVNGDLDPDSGDDSFYNGNSSNYLYSNENLIFFGKKKNILDSVIGFSISGNDYIKDHYNEYYLDIDYNFVYEGGTINHSDNNQLYEDQVNTTFHQRVALTPSPYYITMNDLFNNMYVGDDSVFTVMNQLFRTNLNNSSNYKLGSVKFDWIGFAADNFLPGLDDIFGFDLLPSIPIDFTSYKFYAKNSNFYKVNKAFLSVNFTLGTSDNFDINKSYSYGQLFNFVDGTSTVSNNGISVNPNPFIGDNGEIIPLPDQGNNYPSAGGSSAGGGNANVNVVVNNSGQKIPVNVQSEDELEDVIQRYGHLQQTLAGYFQDISEETSNNNFFGLLGDTLPMIPYLDFMLKCSMCVIGLGVILFVLKVLLR